MLECIQMAEAGGSGLTDHCLEYALCDVISGMTANNERLENIAAAFIRSGSGQPIA